MIKSSSAVPEPERCMRRLINVEEAREVSKDRSKWLSIVSSSPPAGKMVSICMCECIFFLSKEKKIHSAL